MNQTLKSVSQHPYIVNGWFTNYEFSSWSIKFSNCCLAILTFAMVDLLTLKSTTIFICSYSWIRLTQFCFAFSYFLIAVESGFKIFYLKLKKKNQVKYSTKIAALIQLWCNPSVWDRLDIFWLFFCTIVTPKPDYCCLSN